MKRLLAYLFIVLGFTISIQTKSYAPMIIVEGAVEKLNPNSNISKSSNNKVALIIGINNYAYIPKATFANHDAKYFHHYAKNIFGIKNENIKLLIDREANLINFMRATKKWLPGKIKNGKTELIIFFAGHGLASNDRKDLYILPQDGDVDLLRQTGISLSELYKHISELRPKNVTMFMDTAFSGVSPEATFANLIVNSKLKVPDNFTIFNSSKLNQISSSSKELNHGIFSYYLMKGLEGNADLNRDMKITNGELFIFMDQKVSQSASKLGRKQNPFLIGDPDKVLISNNNKTQIAKAEPSQTQEVTKKINVIYNAYSMRVNILNLGYTTVLFLDNGKCKASSNLGGIFRNYKYEGDQQVKCKWQYADDKNHIVNINFGYGIKNIITENAILKKDLNGEIYAFAQSRSLKVVKEDPNNIIRLAKKYDVSEFLSLINKKQKTQIAKAEPSQTQKVTENYIPKWFINMKGSTDKIIYARGTAVSKTVSISKEEALEDALIKSLRRLFTRITSKEAGTGNSITKKIISASGKFITKCIEQNGKLTCTDNRNDFNWSSVTSYKIEKTDTKELTNGEYRTFTIISVNPDEVYEDFAKLLNLPERETKVAKIEEPKQDEFKPEKTNQDNIKPIIDIKSEYTFKDAEYTFKGKVKDKGGSEKLYLFSKKGDSKRKLVTTDKKGKFEITGFSLESEEITLIAIDSSNNETEKIVKVIIDIEEETEIAKVYEQLKPIKKGKKDNNRVAIIIGVESYEKSSKALYADNDAKMFKYFATKALGINSANIKLLVDNEAKRLDTIEALKAWLPKKILKDKSELFVFFSGHGYPSNDNNLYLIPQNGDPRFLEESALSKNYIIEQIQKLEPKSVTMFFDACYSGNGKDGEVLVAGLKPIRKLEIKEEIPENFYIFSSSNYNQESSTIKEAEHGIFSYYLMKGLEGNADENKDKKITNGELIAYLKDNVSQEAFTQNRAQDPMLAGDPDKVLMSYR